MKLYVQMPSSLAFWGIMEDMVLRLRVIILSVIGIICHKMSFFWLIRAVFSRKKCTFVLIFKKIGKNGKGNTYG